MEYRALNVNEEEIRLISLVSTPESTNLVADLSDNDFSDIVHCQLENFSLASSKVVSNENTSDDSFLHRTQDESSLPLCRADSPKWRFSWGDYIALSYTWGNPTDKSTIVLNGHLTIVGANLKLHFESSVSSSRCEQGTKFG